MVAVLHLVPSPGKTTAIPTRAQGSGRGQDPIRTGAVISIPPSEASTALRSGGYQLLDIRPQWEWNKARIPSALHVPLFVEDTDTGPLTYLKKYIHFGYIGLWTGQLLTTFNGEFLYQVEAAVPDKEEKLLVACGEGLRSRIAVSMLYRGGFKNLGWLAGGFSRSKKGDFGEVEGETDLRYATVGGASYVFLRLLLLFGALDKDN